MKYIPWICCGVGMVIGIILTELGAESYIGLICALGGLFLGEILKLELKCSADKRTRQRGIDYSPNEWEKYKKNLKD